MRGIALAVSFSVIASAPASADDLSACRSIKDNLARLTCYDAIADKTPSGDSAKPPEAASVSSEGALTLASWDYASKKGDFGDSYSIKYTLHNGYDKKIKLIDGTLRFSDLLGATVYAIKLDKDVSILSKKDGSFSGSYSRYGADADRMANMLKSDIATTLVIRAIIFSDNSIVRFGN